MRETKLFAYVDKGTFIHRLSGLTKLICFLLLTLATMFTFDIRVLGAMVVLSISIAIISKLPFKRYRAFIAYILVFLLFNFCLNFLLAPDYGEELFGTRHELIVFTDFYTLTLEEVFYQLCKGVKFLVILPLGLLFFYTIHPSELASSLNGIKVPYKVCTVFSLALRYFPDIQRDYTNINLAQQARGIDTSKIAPLKNRVLSFTKVLIPLVFSTLDRVDLISNAMELRGYGKDKTRTWYSYKKLQKNDYVAIGVCIAVFVFVLIMRFLVVKELFWNPFI